jgi:folate-dependent phosphoribosylglycinamide formyltransferase PurN
MTLPIVVMVSGSGRSLANILEREQSGRLCTTTKLVIASKAGIGAIAIAESHGVPVQVLQVGQTTAAIDAVDPRLIVMAGYLKKWPIPARYVGRTINIHPSLLPLFGGRGFYGHHVHQAVLDAGMRVSGCSVHFVTPEYDAGPIIDQRAVHLFPGDTAEQIATRVFAAELDLLPEVIEMCVTGEVVLDPSGCIVRFRPGV